MTDILMIRSLLVAGLLIVALAGGVFAEELGNQPSRWSGSLPQLPSALSHLSTVDSQDVIRQTPTLSGRLQLREQTLIPYIGAGFGGGFITERDRALGPSSGFSQQNILGESLGKGVMPNEFQMGIRIPF